MPIDNVSREAVKAAIRELRVRRPWYDPVQEASSLAALAALPAAEGRWENLRDELRDAISWLHASCGGIDTDFVLGKRAAYEDCLKELNRLLGDRCSVPAEAAPSVERLPCGHPIQSLGKVRDDDASEEVHCLWCGDIQDLSVVLDNLGRVYCHVTGGKVSKPMTDADVVIALADDHLNEIVDEALKEAAEDEEE